MSNLQNLAKNAALENYGELAVGEYQGVLQEDQNQVLSYLFASKLKGYPDWQISVTLSVDGDEATVSEVTLLPSTQSLIAPKWVPWSERLADYKALQAALEAEAAAAALEADDSDDIDETDSDELDEASELEAEASEDNATLTGHNAEFEDESAHSQPQGNARRRRRKDTVDAPAQPAEGIELPLTDVPETVDAEGDADSASAKGKGLFKWKTLRGGKKRK